jgi:hypothetical protein
MLTSAPATPEYQSTCRKLAVRLVQASEGYTPEELLGAAIVLSAGLLLKYAEGEHDVDDFADKLRVAINDTLAARVPPRGH